MFLLFLSKDETRYLKIRTADEWDKFFDAYKKETRTDWILDRSKQQQTKEGLKLVLRQNYV